MSSSATRRTLLASLLAENAISKGAFSQSRQATPDPLGLMESATGPTIGSPDAIVKMHIYNDFQSHYGRDFYFQTLPFVFEDFIQTGEVALIFHDFPRLGTNPEIADPDNLLVELADLRNESSLAAQAAMIAGEQGKYLQMCDRLFGSYQDVQSGIFLRKNLNRMALAIQLDIGFFNESMDSGHHIETLANSVNTGWNAGITAMPMFILDNGRSELDVIQNTASGYSLLMKRIKVAIATAE